MAARGLGKGLDALIPAGDKKITKEENTKGAETVVKITKVEPNKASRERILMKMHYRSWQILSNSLGFCSLFWYRTKANTMKL